MTSRLKWVKAMLREVIQVRRKFHRRLDYRGFRSSCRYFRSLKDNQEKGRFLSDCTGVRRGAADGAHKHIQNGNALKEAVGSIISHVYQGTAVDSYQYVGLLRECFKQKDLESVLQVHACIKETGLEQNLYVANSLLKCYIGCGRLHDALELFDMLLDKNLVSWATMIGGYAAHDQAECAIGVYRQMRIEGWQPDAVTYISVLKACASPVALEWGKDIHGHIIRSGFQGDVRVSTALVNMYANCGSIENAKVVFDRMETRNVISWSAMIKGLAQHGLGHEAFSLFLQMQSEGFVPNWITYMSILNPCSSAGALKWVKEVHAHAKKTGLDVDLHVGNALVHMYAKSSSIKDARAVFDRMGERSLVSYNIMIGGLAQHGLGHEAFSLFLQMGREGFKPDSITYRNILNPCLSTDALVWVKEVHAHAMKSGLDVDLRVANALVHMYAKIGNIGDAREVFEKMLDRDVVSWSVMIGGLAQHRLGHEAFSLFLQMQCAGFVPNWITYVNILNPNSSTGALEWVKKVHAHAMKDGVDVNLRVGNAFVRMYAKIGSIADAIEVFEKMLDRDVHSWAVMIDGLAHHGQGRLALQLFEEMNVEAVKPSRPLFVGVLSACSHGGLVDEGRFQFVSMTRDYNIKPDLEHFTCMVDILGRAGYLEEAKLCIFNMPVKPDIVIWKALLGACRRYNNAKLGELAATECLKLDPMDPHSFVLLSNIYAAVGNWNQVSLIRNMMQEKGIRKNPGQCWIEVDNEVHHFIAGDTSHLEAAEIYDMLRILSEKLKTEGYIPDTRLVLRNIDEDEKKSALCSHSERLAIAYGLMHVSPGKPIRIYKNLRICTDCHAATKLISKITGREIVARDVKRFHHFKHGVCSCGDFW